MGASRLSYALLEALTGCDGMREVDLLDSIEGRKSMKHVALRLRREAGKVTRTGAGGKTDPYRYSISAKAEGLREAEPLVFEVGSIETLA